MSQRVIVAQPASLCREGAGLLQVGVLRWMLPPRKATVFGTKLTLAPAPAMTFVVKVTYSYAGCVSTAGEVVFAEGPEGLSLDVPSELHGAEEGEIACPSDFVPHRGMCDVLVTGHAYCRRPRERIPAGIELGTVSRRFLVEGGREVVRAPLLGAAILGLDGAPVERVGPSLTPKLIEDFPVDFDFATYNTAPPSQRLEELPPGATLTLSGLCERAEQVTLRLPAAAPVMWADTSEESGLPVPLRCDTVWIDTDRELLVMVYRGLTEVPSLELDGVTQVTLALGEGGERPALADVQKDLARGVFEAAVELSDFEDDARPAPEAALFARYEALARSVEPTISLETYALVSASLAEGKGPRHETLERHGFDEDTFLIEERGWLTRMGDAAMSGDTAPATRYGELFVEAQDRLAGPGEGREALEEYVMLKVDVEDADDPTAALSDRKMTLAEWMRMDRRWTRRAIEDRSVEIEVERLSRAYRASRGEG